MILNVQALNSDGNRVGKISEDEEEEVAEMMKIKPELKTLEWWISGLRLNPLFFLIFRLNIACSPLIFNLQINYPIRFKDIPFKSSHLWVQFFLLTSVAKRWPQVWIFLIINPFHFANAGRAVDLLIATFFPFLKLSVLF